jgi:threonine dehydratase
MNDQLSDIAPPTYMDIRDAAERIGRHVVRTPLLACDDLSERTRGRIFLKAEVLQKTGSFKYRGATNRVLQLTDEERSRGVVAYSSGNHAQAVAAAAQRLSIPATIVMPRDAPKLKLENTQSYGAEIVLYDRFTEDRASIAHEIAERRGATIVPPYDDPRIIAGQGTLGLEVAAQASDHGVQLDALLCPCSGGGLIAGTALAFAETSPSTRIHSVEPAGFDDTARSLKAGIPQKVAPDARSICDSLLSDSPGKLTFPINRGLLSSGLVVDDSEVRSAMIYAFRTLKLVIEPGGAVALAALLAGRFDASGKTVAIVCSGGNVDPDLFRSILV